MRTAVWFVNGGVLLGSKNHCMGLAVAYRRTSMASLCLEEGREEIALLLEYGTREFDNGRPLVALSMLFEAQFALNEMLQNAMVEAVELPSRTSSTSTVVH